MSIRNQEHAARMLAHLEKQSEAAIQRPSRSDQHRMEMLEKPSLAFQAPITDSPSFLEKALQASLQSLRHKQEPEPMKIGTMIGGKYLKKDDCDPPLLLTISGFAEENVATDDKPQEMKWVMQFEESEKGLVMNTTNLQLAAIAFGSQDTDDWLGKQIVCYHDPNISFGGKVVGGVRVRAPKRSVAGKSSAKVPAMATDPRPEPPVEEDSDIPF
jgi:hypothetical protein